MSRVCQITGKKGLSGHRVSHANNKSNHVQKPNLITKRVFVPELGRSVKVRMSTSALRTLDKKGAYRTLKDAGLI